jgi:transcriptional regulator with XRE-family HTH domain
MQYRLCEVIVKQKIRAAHDILYQFLRDTSMSQFEAAKRMGISKGHMSRVLRGEREITNSFLWCFQKTFVRPDAPFYLPQADSVMHEIEQSRTNGGAR